MNRIITTLIITLAACAASAIGTGTLSAVELKEGDNTVLTPSQAVALHAIGTNATGTVTLKKVTALSVSWTETRTVTNITYTTAWSNLTHTVTNDIVTAWRTNAVGIAIASNGVTNVVVETNFLDRAVNAMPSVYPYPDLLIITNKEPVVEVYTNIPYQVEASRRIERITTPHQTSKVVTNDLLSTSLSSGFKTNTVNCLFAPGDWISASGTAFKGGKVQLIIEK